MTDVITANGSQNSPKRRTTAMGAIKRGGIDEIGAPELTSGAELQDLKKTFSKRPTSEEEEEEEEEDECTDGAPDELGDEPSGLSVNSGQSPRYEAFVMTGEKILRLNPKISPNYAKAKQAELPKHMQVLDSPPTLPRHPFADLEPPNGSRDDRRGRRRHQQNNQRNHQPMPPSQSENVLASSSSSSSQALASMMNAAGVMGVGTENGNREPSLVTVHGFGAHIHNGRGGPTASSDIDTVGDSRSAVQSVEFGSHQHHMGNELPSPVSPSYYSEPVSPARFAFGQAGQDSPGISRQCKQPNGVPADPGQPCGPVSVKVIVGQSTPLPSDAESPGSSSHSTPLKEKLQNLDNPLLASQSPSLSASKDLDVEAAKRLAKRLYALEGFRKSDVMKHFVKNNEFNNLVAMEYVKQFNFAGLRIDAALRKFLFNLTLTGETSERERVLTFFSKRYLDCNPVLFDNEDAVHTLTCALLLLNTDLHNQNVGKRMSCHDFIENISQASGYTFRRDLLRSLYQSIKSHPIEWARDYSESGTSASGLSHDPSLDDKLLELPDPDSQVEYKKGWVMRKCVIDDDGKKMPFGRRSWRMFYATLKGMVLYLHKDEHGFKKSSYQTFRNAIRIHHALASRASDYIKKQHVFRLHTAGLAEYLFQTSDPKEMQSWIDSINFVAACFSAPVFPAPISSRKSFHRPLIPSGPSKLSVREQCAAHESRVKDIERQLDQLRFTAPGRTARPKQLQEYAEKEIFLLYDLQKYTIYTQVLHSRLDEQLERTVSIDLQTSMESSITNGGGDGGGRFSAQSGQSDRLSYRAAIAASMTTNTGGYSAYETNL